MGLPNRLLMFVVAELLGKHVEEVGQYSEEHLLEWKAYLDWKAEQIENAGKRK